MDKHKWVRTYEPGAVIFERGMPCVGLHCIQTGLVALRRTDDAGRAVVVRIVPARRTLGVSAFLRGGTFDVTAHALTPTVVCMIPSATLEPILQVNPAQLRAMLTDLGNTVSELETAMLRLGAMPLRARVAQVLLDFTRAIGTADDEGNLTVVLPVSRIRLAEMVGARPESLTRTLAVLESAKVARFSGRRFVVPDLDLLLDEVEAASA